MRIIDSHCHLDDFVKEGSIDKILDNAARASVDKMVAVGTCQEDWEFYSDFVRQHDNIYYTVGLHPLYAEQLETIVRLPSFLSKDVRPVAIGEIGLDYHRLPEGDDARIATINLQKKAFEEQLQIAKFHNLPVVIHSRQAFDDTFNILEKTGASGDKVLFHCYDYGTDEMEQLKDFGAFVSFSGSLTFKKKLAAPLQMASLDRLLVETDCPYLTPESHKPNQNQPAYIRATAKIAANILGISEENFCSLTHGNTERFFNMT
jgi:TatD DNase family protein